MRFVIVGAGAVGAPVGAQLARAGHDVSFWVRPAQRREPARLKIEPVAQPGHSHEVFTQFLRPGDSAPASDWLFVCVRGEQLDATPQQLAAQFGVHCKHHGPKIREQTCYSLALLQQRAALMPALHALSERFEQRLPADTCPEPAQSQL